MVEPEFAVLLTSSKDTKSQAGKNKRKAALKALFDLYISERKPTQEWTMKQLDTLIKNSKSRAAELRAERVKTAIATGGGPPLACSATPADERLAAVVDIPAQPLVNVNDSDAPNDDVQILPPATVSFNKKRKKAFASEKSETVEKKITVTPDVQFVAIKQSESEALVKKLTVETQLLTAKLDTEQKKNEKLRLQIELLKVQLAKEGRQGNAAGVTQAFETPLVHDSGLTYANLTSFSSSNNFSMRSGDSGNDSFMPSF